MRPHQKRGSDETDWQCSLLQQQRNLRQSTRQSQVGNLELLDRSSPAFLSNEIHQPFCAQERAPVVKDNDNRIVQKDGTFPNRKVNAFNHPAIEQVARSNNHTNIRDKKSSHVLEPKWRTCEVRRRQGPATCLQQAAGPNVVIVLLTL